VSRYLELPLIFTVLVAGLPSAVAFQSGSSLGEKIGIKSIQLGSPARSFQAIADRFDGAMFDPQAADLLASTDALTKMIFYLGEATLDRSATYRNTDGDCLLASWRFGGGANTLLLDDSPYQSIYSFRLKGFRQVTMDGLVSFLGELIAVDQPPLNLKLTALNLQAGPGPSNILSFTGWEMRYASGLRNMSIWGAADGRDWFIGLSVPRSMEGSLDHTPILIPERFPPLSELLKTWTFDHVWSEVGRHGESLLASMWADQRNRMLIAELARRGISEEQFRVSASR
jgi:hypothetical protein